eukprot:3766324-Prymnesium_polylepis.1
MNERIDCFRNAACPPRSGLERPAAKKFVMLPQKTWLECFLNDCCLRLKECCLNLSETDRISDAFRAGSTLFSVEFPPRDGAAARCSICTACLPFSARPSKACAANCSVCATGCRAASGRLGAGPGAGRRLAFSLVTSVLGRRRRTQGLRARCAQKCSGGELQNGDFRPDSRVATSWRGCRFGTLVAACTL